MVSKDLNLITQREKSDEVYQVWVTSVTHVTSSPVDSALLDNKAAVAATPLLEGFHETKLLGPNLLIPC